MSRSEAMSATRERTFRARLDALPETAVFVETFCSDNDVTSADAMRLTLIVEELFTNTVMHGHRGDSEAAIYVSLSVEPDAVLLAYQDEAPPHDTLAHMRALQADADDTLRSGRVGGIGLLLVTHIGEGARYVYEGGRNCLWLRLPKLR
jgi:anti-sigma regulatory factor (Ser/Thr protein kinase)